MKHNLTSNIRKYFRLAVVAMAMVMVFAACEKEDVQKPESTIPEVNSNLPDMSSGLGINLNGQLKGADPAIATQVVNSGYTGLIQRFPVEGHAPGHGYSPYLKFPRRYVYRSSAHSSQTQHIWTVYEIYKRLEGSSQWTYYGKVSPATISISPAYPGGYLDACFSIINFDTRGSSYYQVKQTVAWYSHDYLKIIGTKTIYYNGYNGTTDYSNPVGYWNVTAYTNQIYFLGY